MSSRFSAASILSDVCELITDGTHFSPASFKTGEFMYITSKNVREARLDLTDITYVSRDVHNSIFSGCPVRFGDVLYVKDGANTGLAAINTIKQPFSMLSSVALIRPKGNRLDAKYLMHWLNSPHGRAQMLQNMSGAAIKRLVLAQIRRALIPLPPIGEQRRIAAILDQADDLRRKRRRTMECLDALSRSIFFDMFVVSQNAWNFVPLQALGLGDDAIKCGPFGTQLYQNEFQTAGVPLWGIKHVNSGFTLPTNEFLSERKSMSLMVYDIRPLDIVMTRKGTVGNCAVYPIGAPPGIMHSDLLRVRVDQSRYNPIFVTTLLKFSSDVERQIAVISGGAVMPGINVTRLKKLKVPSPPKNVQDAFAARVAEIDKLKTHHRAHLAKLDALFASLQQRAFRGEL